MTPALLAIVILARQNPSSPQVLLPAGWKTTYFPQNDHHVALLLGPHGERIAFHAYSGSRSMNFTGPSDGASGEEVGTLKFEDSGTFVARLRARDPKALFLETSLGDRPVTATLASDGTLAISLGERKPIQHGADSAVDFTSKVKTAQELAVVLTVILSRLDTAERDSPAVHADRPTNVPTPPVNVRGDRFPGSISLPEGFVFHRKPQRTTLIGRFEHPSEPAIKVRTVHPESSDIDSARSTTRPDWDESVPLLHASLQVKIDPGKWISADFGPTHDAHLAFVANSDTPRAAFTTLFAALTYRP